MEQKRAVNTAGFVEITSLFYSTNPGVVGLWRASAINLRKYKTRKRGIS